MGQLAPAEHHAHDDFIFVFEKLPGLADLDVQVVIARLGAHTNFLDLHLVAVAFVFPFFLLVFELAKIHYSANGRTFVWRHFHQIEIGHTGLFHGLVGGHDSQLASIRGNDADRTDADLFVNSLLDVACNLPFSHTHFSSRVFS